jgi:acetyl esterase/lipase
MTTQTMPAPHAIEEVTAAMPVAALPRPRARWRDSVRVAGAVVSAACRALARRLLGRSVQPTWSLKMELSAAALRGLWSVIPAMGVLRWRNVCEAMSPLRTDGLAPRFVDLNPGREPPLHAAWLEPPDAGAAVVLYLHGGGFASGSVRTVGDMVGALARSARAGALSLEYRLAPEHPFPAAVADATRAYRHLLGLGISPRNIALAGDSSGGTLVLNTLLALRDSGLPLPGAAVTISPWVDLGCSGGSFERNAPYDFASKECLLLLARHYLAGKDAASPEISPLYAALSGLPPLLVQAGSRETLIDQIRAFVARAREAGTALTFSEYPDMVHVWHLLRGMTPEASRAIAEAGAFIRTHAAGGAFSRVNHATVPSQEEPAMNIQAISQKQTPAPSLVPRFESVGVTFPEGYRREQSPVFARNELFVPAPAERVWEWLVKAGRWPEFYGNARDVEIEGGSELEKGTLFHWTTFGIRAHTTVTELVPNERLSWSGKGLGSTAYHGWVLRPCEGGCYVITEETQQGFVVSVGRAILRRGLLRWHQRWLEGLSRVAVRGGLDLQHQHSDNRG